MEPFQVYARIRPPNSKQLSFSSQSAVSQLTSSSLSVSDSELRQTVFQLDHVYTPSDNNQYIFSSAIMPIIDGSLAGINSTILAYGITGAGKSHTIFGGNEEVGIIEYALEYLCSQAETQANTKITMSYMEIYNEQVYDLLRPNSEPLLILDDPNLGVIVNELSDLEIHTSRSAQALIELGNTRRVVAQTKANQFSSRSHAIVQVTIEKKTEDRILIGKLSLVDLAGSERQTVYSQQKGLRNLQGSNINRSLLTLGNCITVLSDKKKGGHVPYRDSKLTRLLKDSLGGNTKTVMIACISPSILTHDQTLNTMKYACRAKRIQKIVVQNVRQNRSNQQLKREVARLQRQLERRQAGRAANIEREEMQIFIQKLINNVEALTTARLRQNVDLTAKMQEVELLDQQNRLVSSILLKCCPEPESAKKEPPRSRTTDLLPRRSSKLSKISRNNSIQIQQIMNLDNPFAQIPEVSQCRQQSTLAEPSSSSCHFARGHLQNTRIQYQKQKKILRESTKEYALKWSDFSERKRISDGVKMLLDRPNNVIALLGQKQRAIVDKIVREERITIEQLGCLDQQEGRQVIAGDMADFDDNNRQLKEPSTRFLSSLRQIRAMMHRFPSTTDPIETQPSPQTYDDCLRVDRQLFVSE